MSWYNKKGAAPAFDIIIYAVLGLVFLATVIGIYVTLQGSILNQETFSQTGCWLTNTIKCNGGLFSGMPSLCLPETLEKSVDTAKLADLTRDTWWMYKEGECDMGNVADEVYSVYSFTPEKDISLAEFYLHLLSYNREEETSDISKSDYAYLEANTKDHTICFDKSEYAETNSIQGMYLEGGKLYYMLFYDDQPPEDDGGDKILISQNPEYDAGLWKSLGTRAAIVGGTVAAIATLPAVGAGIVVYSGGAALGTITSSVIVGTGLAAEAVGGTTIAITGLGLAGTNAGTFYATAESDNTACVQYGFVGELNE